MNRKQFTIYLFMLVVYAFCAFATYAFFTDELARLEEAEKQASEESS